MNVLVMVKVGLGGRSLSCSSSYRYSFMLMSCMMTRCLYEFLVVWGFSGLNMKNPPEGFCYFFLRLISRLGPEYLLVILTGVNKKSSS